MPRLRIKDKIIDAIKNGFTVEIVYKGLTYIYDPYMIFASHTGKYYCFGWKRSGGYIKIPGPHFMDAILREITSVRIVGRYEQLKVPHNHSSSDRFYKLVYCSCFHVGKK